MATFLVVLHVLAAALWLGGAAYERFLVVPAVRARWGRSDGWSLLGLMLRPEKLVMATVAVLAASGAALAIIGHDGFFLLSWVGAKQAILALILVTYVTAIRPDLKRFKGAVGRVSLTGGPAISLRHRFERIVSRLDLIHVGIVVNVILAVWKPGT